MPTGKPERKKDDHDEREQPQRKESRPSVNKKGEIDLTPIDSYTGEPMPFEPEGDIPIDDMEVESFADETDLIPLEEDQAMDFLLNDAAAGGDGVMDHIDDFTEDEDILDDFADRQGLSAGAGVLLESLLDHHSKGPILSGGDIDADWGSSVVSGEESVGGSTPTPDQDVVDELGGAVGITYDDNEELATADKLEERDRNRWELDPRSAIDEDDEDEDLDELQEVDEF